MALMYGCALLLAFTMAHVDSAGNWAQWRGPNCHDRSTDIGRMRDWAMSESPVIDGDQVVVTPGKHKNTMVALNKSIGKTVWAVSVEGDKGAGHASIVTSEINGTRVYVQTTASNVLGVRASDGKVM